LSLLQSAHPALHAPSHVPPPQVGEAMLLLEQTLLQPPQSDALALMLVSQPSVSLFALQSAKPALHAPSQTPPAHAGVMLLLEQALPQPPQCEGLVSTSVSQPLLSLLLSQSAKPALQVPSHVPPPHAGVAMLLLEHAFAHASQCLGSVASVTSHPSVSLLPSQSAVPGAHMPLHTPAPHVIVDMLLAEHSFPQPPQDAGLVRRSVHAELQHAPPASPSGQTLPHPLQLLSSTEVSVQTWLQQALLAPASPPTPPPIIVQSAEELQPWAHVYSPLSGAQKVPNGHVSICGRQGTQVAVATSQTEASGSGQSLFAAQPGRHTPASRSQ
jgi:hypothetical protein